MAHAREFIATIENGKLPRDASEGIASIFRRMEGKRVSITLKEWRRSRSFRQNKFYWGVVVPIICDLFQDAGNDADAETVHAYLKEHVGEMISVILDPSGKRRSVVGSSTKLTTKEWEDFIEKIRAWAAQFSVIVPMPNEYLEGCAKPQVVLREGEYAED